MEKKFSKFKVINTIFYPLILLTKMSAAVLHTLQHLSIYFYQGRVQTVIIIIIQERKL